MLPTLVFSSASLANEIDNNVDEYYSEDDSLYRYSALQNTNSFFAVATGYDADDIDSIEEEQDESEFTESGVVVSGDVTEKFEDIIRRQNISIQKSDEAMSDIEDRNGVRTFIVGNRLGVLKFQMVQMEAQSRDLEFIAQETEDNKVKTEIVTHLDISEKQQRKVEDFITRQESEFSLLGWFVSSL